MLRPAVLALSFIVMALHMPARPAWADEHETCRAERGPEAMAACDLIIAESANYTRDQLGIALINRGQQHYENKDYDRAIADFQRAIPLNPKWVQLAYGNMGNCYYALGQDTRAIELYTRGIELDPDYASAYTARGQLHEKAGDIEKAKADYRQALEANAPFSDTEWAHETAEAALKRLER